MKALLIALGAGVGAPSRYVIDNYVKKLHKSLIPYETLGINTVGSFILGLVIHNHGNYSLIIGTGFASSFTTWSTLAYEQHTLLQSRHYSKALFYILLTLIMGVGAAALGVALSL